MLFRYAFSYKDYIDPHHIYAGRLPFFYALRDSFGLKDVLADSLTTAAGTGFSYRTFESAGEGESGGRGGMIHQGKGRDRRVKAGLRYKDGGKTKYWLGEEDRLLANEVRGQRVRNVESSASPEGRDYDDLEEESDANSLGFGDANDQVVEALYADSRRLEYGDQFPHLSVFVLLILFDKIR